MERDQRVGFFRSRRQDAAGAVIFERASHMVDAVRQQGRGQGISLISRQGLAIEGETERPVPVDASAGGRAERLRHDGRSSPGL